MMTKLGRRFTHLVAACLLSAACIGTLAGCSDHAPTGELKETESKKLQIGMSFDSFVIERWTQDRDVFVSTAQSLDVDVNVQNANGDVQEQIEQLEYFIRKDVDVIVVIAIDGDALSEVLGKAKDAGIKVVCYDRIVRNCNADLYISFDNYEVGKLMGEALGEALPDGGKIFEINGSPTDYNVVEVVEGFTDAIEGSNLELVYTSYCDNWLAELAFTAVNEGLGRNVGVDGIMCGNDDLAGQAIRALSEKRLAGKVPIVAQDADLSACQRIVEGTQTMTVYKPVDKLAKIAAQLAVSLARGEDITVPNRGTPVTETINDGTNDIPYYCIKPIAVTRDNIDEVIIDSGFHRKEEVYLNVKP